jgi:sugar lactone lactonase YvrE
VTTLAGSSRGYADGTGTAAQFALPAGIAADGENLYVADSGNHRIRKIVIASGVVTTLAGDGTAGYADGRGAAAQFNRPGGVAVDGGVLYVADQNNHRIRKIVIASGEVTTYAGSTQGYADGRGTAAQFNAPYSIAVYGGKLYVTDTLNHRIRVITP